MLSIKKSFLSCLFYLPLILAIFNGHQLLHAFEGDDHFETEELCLVCELQMDQQDEHYLMPSSPTVVDVRLPITTEVVEPFTLFLQTNSVHFKLTTRPPPIV